MLVHQRVLQDIYIDGTYITAFDGNNCRTPLGEVAKTCKNQQVSACAFANLLIGFSHFGTPVYTSPVLNGKSQQVSGEHVLKSIL